MTQESPREGLDPPVLDTAATSHAPEAVQSLRLAMRRARFDDAERIGVLSDLRETKIGRLELLQDALKPLLAQIPKNVDLFDVGVMPGATPRLFIDMIGFVEMARDARVYRFLQDTRHNRLVLAESAETDVIVEAVTDYVARRLLEREKALASDAIDAAPDTQTSAPDTPTTAAPSVSLSPRRPKPRGLRRVAHWGGIAFAFMIDLLGAIAFFTILAAAGWLLWTRLHGQV